MPSLPTEQRHHNFQMLITVDQIAGGLIKGVVKPRKRDLCAMLSENLGYDSARMMVILAMDSTKQQAVEQAFMGIYDKGFSVQERKLIDDAFQPGSPLRTQVDEQMSKNGLSFNESASSLDYAASAYFFYHEGRMMQNENSWIGRLFSAIKETAHKLRHGLMRCGFDSAESLFEDIHQGKYASAWCKTDAMTEVEGSEVEQEIIEDASFSPAM